MEEGDAPAPRCAAAGMASVPMRPMVLSRLTMRAPSRARRIRIPEVCSGAREIRHPCPKNRTDGAG